MHMTDDDLKHLPYILRVYTTVYYQTRLARFAMLGVSTVGVVSVQRKISALEASLRENTPNIFRSVLAPLLVVELSSLENRPWDVLHTPSCAAQSINTSYQKLPFGSGDYPDKLSFHQALNQVSNSSDRELPRDMFRRSNARSMP